MPHITTRRIISAIVGKYHVRETLELTLRKDYWFLYQVDSVLKSSAEVEYRSADTQRIITNLWLTQSVS